MNLLNKKIKVQIPLRDNNYKIIDNEYDYITGICIFAGFNEILGYNQVTIDRTPIFPVDFNTITVIQ